MEALEDKAGEIDDYEKKMLRAVEDLEEELMNIEMVLQDALQIATDKFKDKVSFIINDIKAKTINFCSSLKEAFDQFDGLFRTYAYDESDRFMQLCDEDEEFADTQNEDL